MAAHHERLDLRDSSLLRQNVGYNNGQWLPAQSGETFDVLDPATGLKWASCAAMDAADVSKAIAAAEAAFPAYSRMPPRLRAQRLLKYEALLRERKEGLARLLVLETGKPLAEALGEVDYALSFVWWNAGEAERIAGHTVTSGVNPNVRYVTIKQAIGPAALMCAWNFPIALALRKLSTALAAGCTVVLKPSPETPLTALALAAIAEEAGYEPSVINVVTTSHKTTPAVGELLCTHPAIKKISFTGSTRVGKLLARQSASTLKKLCLELGGNGAWVVYDDADLDKAVAALMASKWRAAGQACITANRIYVQYGIASRFTEAFASAMDAQLRLGAGFDEGTTIGPMTTPQGVERAMRHVKDAIERGAQIIRGGARPLDRPHGYFYEPTLLSDVPSDALVVQEETFSPIAAISTFETEEEVTRLVNSTELGLTNYVWTQDLNKAWRALERFESGNVGINTANPTSAESPFGGIKMSGYGKEVGIGAGISEYLIERTGALTLDL